MRDQYNTIKQLLNNVDINSTKNANDPQLPTDIDDHDQNKNENNFLSDNTLHLDYFYHCWIGRLELRSNTGHGFSKADQIRGMVDNIDADDADGVQEDGDATVDEPTSNLKNPHELVQIKIGKWSYWVPSTHVLILKNRVRAIEKKQKIMNNLASMFSKEICKWNVDVRRIFTSFSSFGYGCSDEGKI